VSLREQFRQPTSLGYLALARILIGYHFTMVSWMKISRGFDGDALRRFLAGGQDEPATWHRAFIEGFVLPNADWFSQFVAYGELAIGVSLLTGCLVRVASTFGALENLNIYLAVADSPAEAALHRIYILLHIVFVITAAGRSLGLDAWLHRRFPRARVF
jgi:uncharacterized membrane protein YphA (DoxX/SURF4 family)